MAQYPKVPQFNVADFLARRRQSKLQNQNAGVNYTEILKQESAANYGYSTSDSFAGPKEDLAVNANVEVATGSGNLYNTTMGTL